jgi:cell wall-associated NlpC family hydrolase
MQFTSRGAGRPFFVAAFATVVLMCAAFSVIAHTATAARALATRSHRRAPARVPVRSLAARAVKAALAQRGVPYRYGGASPATGFDCSGLVYWAFGRVGVRLPHSSYALARAGRHVRWQNLRPGDVLVFRGAGHVGLYVGHGRFVHAPHSGTVVRTEPLHGPYAHLLDDARRLVTSRTRVRVSRHQHSHPHHRHT